MDTLILGIYVSTFPIIVAATLTTVVAKHAYPRQLRIPIDGYRVLADGQRLFGDNKTWIGLVSLALFGAIFMMLWGYVCMGSPTLAAHNWFYRTYDNTVTYNLIAGALMGLAYGLGELPNSFMKRRLSIRPGELKKGIKGIPTLIIDHLDSVTACALVMIPLCALSMTECVGVIIVAGLTHLIVNLILVALKVKKNI